MDGWTALLIALPIACGLLAWVAYTLTERKL